jgi:hypothetical protein
MTADVLLYNSLNEQNIDLTKRITRLNEEITRQNALCGCANCSIERSLAELIECAGPNQTGLWCMIPQGSGWTGSVCVYDASGLWRCGSSCTWTVPGGVTCARFQVWGAGAGTGQVWCCGMNPYGGTGAYASIITPVVAGQTYVLCGGCAACCFSCGGWDGCNSFVRGPFANIFAEGGTSNRYFELRHRGIGRYVGGNSTFSWNDSTDTAPGGGSTNCNNWTGLGYLYGCYCHNPNFICTTDIVSTIGTCFGCLPQWGSISNQRKGGGSGCGVVYGIDGSWSTIKMSNFGGLFCATHAPIYGFPDSSCCGECFTVNNQGGFCKNAEFNFMRVPGAGGWANYACNGACVNGGYGRFGMVCVQFR